MKIMLLKKRFEDAEVLYTPELELPETKTVAEICYPAVRFYNYSIEPEYFFILASEVGEYEAYSRCFDRNFALSELGGKEKVERKLRKMYDDMKARLEEV